MARIDVGETAFAGFGVLRRHPLAVLAWALVLFVLAVGPLLLAFNVLAPSVEEMVRQGMSGAEPTPEDLMELQARMMAMNPLLSLSSLVARVLITCAIFRAVLEPGAGRFAFLRLGKAEVMVTLVFVCLIIVLVVGMLVVFAVGGVLAAILSTDSQAAAGIAIAATAIIGGGLAIWVTLRLSMALPMSFAERNFRLFESWALTRGHAGSLLLVLLLVMVVIILIELILAALFGAAGFAALGGAAPDPAAFKAFFSRPVSVWSAELAPWALGVGAVFCLVGSVLAAVATAPWAAAYRALAQPQDSPA